MKASSSRLLLHLALSGALSALPGLCILYPYLPGEYDRLAVGLSNTAQAAGALGLLFVPLGALWLFSELRQRRRRRRGLPPGAGSYAFALASVSLSVPVAAGTVLAAIASAGLALGLLALALGAWVFSRCLRGLKRMKTAPGEGFNPAPAYLLTVPAAALVIQLSLASPATAYSRRTAIANSAGLIQDIEAYRQAHGRYPEALQGVWKDYSPGVTGIEKYHYAREGEAYNLFFEQPRFLLDQVGVREFVVYNPLDNQTLVSHTAWILELPPEELAASQGWFAVHEAAEAHWKYFWFD